MLFAVVTSHSMEKIEDIPNEQYHATWKNWQLWMFFLGKVDGN